MTSLLSEIGSICVVIVILAFIIWALFGWIWDDSH
jgi:hypothetical protein